MLWFIFKKSLDFYVKMYQFYHNCIIVLICKPLILKKATTIFYMSYQNITLYTQKFASQVSLEALKLNAVTLKRLYSKRIRTTTVRNALRNGEMAS